MKFSLCIPMYNESSIITETAKTLSAFMGEHFDDYEIVFSDDGSTDGSADIVRDLALPNIRVIGYSRNRGKGSAVREAMLAAEGDVVMFTDSDLAYGTDVILEVARRMEKEAAPAVLVGSRNLSKDGYEGYTFMRRLASKAYIKLLCTVGGLHLSDSQCGCKSFSRKAADAIFSRAEVNGFAFDFEAILLAEKMGFSIGEFPVKVINHRASKVHLISDAARMLKELGAIKKRVNRMGFDG